MKIVSELFSKYTKVTFSKYMKVTTQLLSFYKRQETSLF